jgi:phosphate starvation-inducible PhoH-like protein
MTQKKASGKFHIDFAPGGQKLAWAAFQQTDVLFLIGPAGTGKTYLAMAFAMHEILQKTRRRIILTRPIVEAGERLGYLPGDLQEKVDPYMVPLYDSMNKLVQDPTQRQQIESSIEVAPIAYLRGRTFDDAVCIFDEAQNATFGQLKLFLTRFGQNSKIIVTGDPSQSDIGSDSGLIDCARRLETVAGVGIIKFKADSIVRHPLVAAMLEKLED